MEVAMTGPILDRIHLEALVATGVIDTVIVAFPDQQGRLMGKRLTGRHFVQHAADEGIHACDYLLTVDMAMEPLPGYRFASWDRGYGDFTVVPDWSTARRLPWLAGTAMVIGDPRDGSGVPVPIAPRQVLRTQVDRAAAAGLRFRMASELEGYLFQETYETAAGKGYRGLGRASRYLEDYHVMQGGREEPVLRRLRNEMGAAGVPMEGTKGEWGRGQVELNLEHAEPLEMADRHVLLKHGAREIAEQQGMALTFMPKVAPDEAGSSCHVHASAWDLPGVRNAFWVGHGGDGEPTATFRHFLAGQLAVAREVSVLFAPTINAYKRYQSLSWAPTAITWGMDNRTCGFRVVGRGPSFRIENRLPGADANPYLAYAAMIGAGIYGITHRLELPDAFSGNAYAAADVLRLPATLREAARAFQHSARVREILGDDVVDHYALTALHEADAYDRAVTDWELARYFEQS
jgi:glutamine synthetase